MGQLLVREILLIEYSKALILMAALALWEILCFSSSVSSAAFSFQFWEKKNRIVAEAPGPCPPFGDLSFPGFLD
jgi:hypothetical protein